MKNKVSVPYMFLGILFCVCLITSNLLEVKIIKIGGLTLTGGLLVFPVSYIINDCISEIWGYKKARFMIWIGFFMNFMVMALCLIAVWLPSSPSWDGGIHFNYVFSLAPRIVAASLAAFLTGSFLNAYIMSRMKIRDEGKRFSLRAVVSTLAGETADSLIFFPIAFGGLVGWKELIIIGLTQVILKSAYEITVLPVTIYVVKKIKKYDGSDVYDRGISYNIFRVGDN